MNVCNKKNLIFILDNLKRHLKILVRHIIYTIVNFIQIWLVWVSEFVANIAYIREENTNIFILFLILMKDEYKSLARKDLKFQYRSQR